MVIARAVPADAGAIAQFQTSAWEQTYRGVVPDRFLGGMDAAASAARWSERLASGGRRAFTASLGERLVAVASTTRSDPQLSLPELELNTLYLLPEVQGTGLADRMLDAAIGDEAAHLLVFRANSRAHGFYRRHGFAPVGEILIDPGTGLAEQRWVRERRR
ncbi:GNAT family N-acetyltransferase [Microbacterium sp. KSW4-17]|uniref:GNAT family N-acetyltransferase n=1 Tax=Microbacterium galbum TaxID=3075994 RepID=A0ABU3T5H4_9MICO|nr:GNAT family N-acetyltransferase [Microbacterium sp. KSW4-17]MDU0366618.1 GNAT family N-acetyltransferase [Microbacterium sp. KSW4-17]